MPSHLPKNARQNLQQKLLRASSIPSAKETVPFVVARLEKWTMLIDGSSPVPLKPYLPTPEECAASEVLSLRGSTAVMLSRIVRESFRKTWWDQFALQFESEAAAEQAWLFCCYRLYSLLNATITGQRQGLHALILAVEDCLI